MRRDVHIHVPSPILPPSARPGRYPPIAGAAATSPDAIWFRKGLGHMNDGTVDWDDNATTTIMCALATTTYAPNQDTDEFYNPAFNANEVPNGSGYTTKGIALATRSVNVSAVSKEAQLITTTNPQWTSSTFNFRYAIVYKDTGVATTSPVLWVIDCNHINATNLSVVSGTLTITWTSNIAATIDANAYQV